MSTWMSSPNGKWHVGPDGACWSAREPFTAECGASFVPRNVTASIEDLPPCQPSGYCAKCAAAAANRKGA